MARSNVDLPAPLAPMMAVSDRSGMVIDTESRARTGP